MISEEKRQKDWAKLAILAKVTIARLEEKDRETEAINEKYWNEPTPGTIKVLGVHKL